jgi:hypothetical protein
MQNFDDLVQRILEKATTALGPLPPPANPDVVRDAERQLGFSLPGLLVAIYTNVADGGFGPGSDVPIPGYNVGRLYSIERLVQIYTQNRTPPAGSPYRAWPEGVVPMLTWGGFAEAAIDCLDRDAPVLRYDSDVDAVEPEMAWKIDAPNLATWWTRWLQGSFEEPTEVWNPRRG